jgi:hypothetical protein
VPSNIFANNPSGPECGNDSKHLWPEVTVIFRALSLPGNTERLARVSSDKKVNWVEIIGTHLAYIRVAFDQREILS